MSANGDEMDALLDAVRDRLRSVLALAPGECDVTPDGQPNPNAGQRFIAVWGGSVTNQQINCLDENYSFKVTVTKRTAQNPRDRKRDGGAWKLALQIRGLLHLNYDVTNAIVAAYPNIVFTKPARFVSATYLGPKGPDWFWADPTGSERDPTGIAIELAFDGARKITYIGDEIPEP